MVQVQQDLSTPMNASTPNGMCPHGAGHTCRLTENPQRPTIALKIACAATAPNCVNPHHVGLGKPRYATALPLVRQDRQPALPAQPSPQVMIHVMQQEQQEQRMRRPKWLTMQATRKPTQECRNSPTGRLLGQQNRQTMLQQTPHTALQHHALHLPIEKTAGDSCQPRQDTRCT
jgi:hypothetical protein